MALGRGDHGSNSADGSSEERTSVRVGPNLFTIKGNRLNFATQVFIDGKTANRAGPSFSVARGSSVMAMTVSNHSKRLIK